MLSLTLRNPRKMKKRYVSAEAEIVTVSENDVISTSEAGVETPEIDPGNPFIGTYDSNGWT